MRYDRKKIEEILENLENVSSDYRHFELALLIFLRSDIETFKDNCISNRDLRKLENLINRCDSILDLDKEDVDMIIGENDYE